MFIDRANVKMSTTLIKVKMPTTLINVKMTSPMTSPCLVELSMIYNLRTRPPAQRASLKYFSYLTDVL